MTTDVLLPTKERLAKGEILAPEVNQTVQRRAYRALTPIEQLHKNGRISDACNDAATKLTKHHLGSLGVDVSSGEGGEPLEFPRSYHATKLSEAEKHLANKFVWWAILELIQETGTTLEDIGRRGYQYRKRDQAHAAGLATVSQGLHRLATFWGMTTSEYHQLRPAP